ncbi:Uncharacterised protein [Candidatus Ornithobacterium hominis]|nr:Uncharacterised protein [Candidatus Ornithobacterium hominis]
MLTTIFIAHFDNIKDAYQELILQQFTSNLNLEIYPISIFIIIELR